MICVPTDRGGMTKIIPLPTLDSPNGVEYKVGVGARWRAGVTLTTSRATAVSTATRARRAEAADSGPAAESDKKSFGWVDSKTGVR